MTRTPDSMPGDDERSAIEETFQPASRRAWQGRGSRRPLAVAALVVLVALVSVAIWQTVSNSPTASPNPLVDRTFKPAPAFSLPSLTDPAQNVSLDTFRGKPLVINFWASWCIPCRTEMPLLEQAYRAEHGRIRFLGIDSNDTSSAGRGFLNQVHVAYPVVSDGGADIAVQYGLFGLPTTIFISPSGKIVGRFIGQLHADSLRAALKEAFHA